MRAYEITITWPADDGAECTYRTTLHMESIGDAAREAQRRATLISRNSDTDARVMAIVARTVQTKGETHEQP